MSFKFIIGLGNPGREYENTCHNAGFLFIDYLKENQRIFNFQLSIFKSTEYMNNSGKFVVKELKKSAAKPEELLIVHDDSDIALGSFKISFGRGAAGHKGAESVIRALRTKDFWRARIGIRPEEREMRKKAEEFVLKRFSPKNRQLLETAFQELATQISAILP